MTVQKSYFTFPSASAAKVTIQCTRWQDDEKTPVGVVIITHGLSENVDMFKELATFLAGEGYICAGMDFLGHGRTAGAGCTGITPDDTNTAVWEDMFTLYKLLRDENPDLPFFSYSHSLGSLMMRTFLVMYRNDIDIKACFFTGDSALPRKTYKGVPACEKIGCAITRYEKDLAHRKKVFVPKDYGSNPPLFRKILLFWLSFDQDNIYNYINGIYSGGVNANFYYVFTYVLKAFSTFAYADMQGWAKKMPDDTVYHHGCGQWDIPGFCGFGPKITHAKLKKAGKKTELYLYKEAMHEVHGEKRIREQFHHDLLKLFNDNNPLV